MGAVGADPEYPPSMGPWPAPTPVGDVLFVDRDLVHLHKKEIANLSAILEQKEKELHRLLWRAESAEKLNVSLQKRLEAAHRCMQANLEAAASLFKELA